MHLKRISFNSVSHKRIPLLVFLGFFSLFLLAKSSGILSEKVIRDRVMASENDKFAAMTIALEKLREEQAGENRKESLVSAIAFYNEKKYNKAKEIILQVLAEEPKNRSALSYREKIEEAIHREKEEQWKRDRLVNQVLQEVNDLWQEKDYYWAVYLLEMLELVPVPDSRVSSRELKRKLINKETEWQEGWRVLAEEKQLVRDQFFKAKDAFAKKNYPLALYLLNKVIKSAETDEYKNAVGLVSGYLQFLNAFIKTDNGIDVYKVDSDIGIHKEALGLLMGYQQKAEEWAEQNLKNGAAAMAKKKYRAAYKYYMKVYKVFPKNKAALQKIGQLTPILLTIAKEHYEKGAVYQGISLLEKAKKEYQLAVSYSPDKKNKFYRLSWQKLQEINGR